MERNAAGAGAGIATDGQLLAEFARQRADAPFVELVERHQDMVFNACLRILRKPPDAEDAAQMVFLALSYKASDPGLQNRASLAGWLHEAAWHVSQRVREAARVRKKREREAGTMQERLANAAYAHSDPWPQLAPVLDGELNSLPEKYRLPIVLHHLEQHSVEETAALIQCSTDATKQRLSRGREMLKDRLSRRGVLLSTGVMATLLASHASAAGLPAAFTASTTQAAVLFITGQAAATGKAAVIAKAAAEAVSRAQLIRRVRVPITVAAVILVALGASGVAWSLLSPPINVATVPAPEIDWKSKLKEPPDNPGTFGEDVKKQDPPKLIVQPTRRFTKGDPTPETTPGQKDFQAQPKADPAEDKIPGIRSPVPPQKKPAFVEDKRDLDAKKNDDGK